MAGFIVDNGIESTITDNPLTSTATTINVADGSDFPSTFPSRMTLWDKSANPDPANDTGMEIIHVTGRTTNALSVVRGQEGTSGVEHPSGENIAMLITAGLFNDATHGIQPAIDLNTAKNTNVSTDLSEGTNTVTTVDVNSSDGTNATLLAASTSRAGLLTKAKFDEIVANTAKVTNATHTGDVTGDAALTVDKTAITNKGTVTAVGADHVLIADASDTGNLKKALISDFASAGDMVASTYDPTAIAADAFDMDNMVESATDKILTATERTKLGTIEESAEVNNISDANATDLTDAGDSILHYHASDRLIDNVTDMNNQSFTNLLENGDFESWSNGATVAPDGWNDTLASFSRESTEVKIGNFSLKWTSNTTHYMYQDIDNFTYYKGRNVIAGVWIKSAVSASLQIYDGIVFSTGTYTDLNNWQFVTISRTIDASATSFRIQLRANVDSATVYFDGAILVEGSICPAFSTKPMAIGDNALIYNKHAVTAVNTDYVLIGDTSDSNNLKKALISDFANVTHTGDVTGSTALTIAADAVTYEKMQNVVADERILGRVSGADGIVEELTPLQVTTMIRNVPEVHTPAAAATATLNLNDTKIHDVTMPAGNVTLAVSNEVNGDIFQVRILQDSSGSRTVTWFSTIKWAGGSAPTLTTTADKADTVVFRCTGTDTYDGFIVGQNI